MSIQRALDKGVIGGLDAEEQRNFEQILGRVYPAGLPVAVNKEPVKTGFKMYTFNESPESDPELGFLTRGNAVYRSDVDAIFIDANLVRDLVHWAPDSFRAYICFVLLHELGHRTLHRGIYGLYDNGVSSSTGETKSVSANARYEMEADEYAIRQFLNYRQAISIIGDSYNSDLLLAVLSMASELPTYLLYQGGERAVSGLYSAAHFDSSHPSIYLRLDRLLAIVEQIEHEDPRTEKIRGIRENLRLDAEATRQIVCEILMPDAVAGAGWTERGLSIMTVLGCWAELPLDEINHANGKTGYHPIIYSHERLQCAGDVPDSIVYALFGRQGPCIVTRTKGVYAATAQGWKTLGALPQPAWLDNYAWAAEGRYVARAPSGRSVAWLDKKYDLNALDGHHLTQVDGTSLNNALGCKDHAADDGGGLPSLGGMSENSVLLWRIAKDEDRACTLQVNLTDEGTALNIGQASEWLLPGHGLLPAPALIAMPTSSNILRIFAYGYDAKPFVMDDEPQFPNGWAVYEVFRSGPPLSRLRRRYESARIPRDENGRILRDWLPMSTLAVSLPPQKLAVSFAMDPTMIIDANGVQKARAWLPASSILASPDGRYFAAMLGSGNGPQRLFVVRNEK